jgi:hypothetical protein
MLSLLIKIPDGITTPQDTEKYKRLDNEGIIRRR